MRSIIKIKNFYKPKVNFRLSLFKNSFNSLKFSTANKPVDTDFMQKIKAGEKLSATDYKSLIINLMSNSNMIKDSKIEKAFSSQLSANINEMNSKELNDIMTVFMQSENLPFNNVIRMIQNRQTELSQKQGEEEIIERSSGEDRRAPRQREEREGRYDSRENQIYVSNLPWSARDEDLAEHFSRFGEVISANVILDRETGKSRGFGFVNFSNAQARDAAVEDNHSIMGRSIYARISEKRPPRREGEEDIGRFNRDRERDSTRSFSESRGYGERNFERSERSTERNTHRSPIFEENRTVFIGNLDFGLTEEKIKNEFSNCGNISRFRLPKNDDGNIKGMCFIEFESERAVNEALRKNGANLNGRSIRVNKYSAIPPARPRYGDSEGTWNSPRGARRDSGFEENREYRGKSNSEGGNRNNSRRNLRNDEYSD